MTRVVVADDQELVRSGFSLILQRAGLEVVGEAADGIEATRQLVAAQPEVRVLALTTFDLDEYVYAAVRAGASGFLLKDVSPADLVHAVGVVARGEMLLAPALTRRLLERFAAVPDPAARPEVFDRLTERELEVLRLVAGGLPNAEIGERLFLSEATVKTYVSRLLSKLDVRDRVQLAVLAYETGLVRPGQNLESER